MPVENDVNASDLTEAGAHQGGLLGAVVRRDVERVRALLPSSQQDEAPNVANTIATVTSSNELACVVSSDANFVPILYLS
jgi:hypothetical protein